MSKLQWIDQQEWESITKKLMEDHGWTMDRDNETTLGFKHGEWVRDYDKKKRNFIQFNENQVVNIRVKKQGKDS